MPGETTSIAQPDPIEPAKVQPTPAPPDQRTVDLEPVATVEAAAAITDPSTLETVSGPETDPGFLARLEASFRLDHHVDRKDVRKVIDYLARRPDRLGKRERLLEYLPYLCERVWDRGLPGEICLLPIIESRLDPFAFSPGGAVGLWQFIPGTARRFGLKIDWWVDERRNVVLATDAALDYLQELHGRFDDWLLALAAYNWGEGRVERELRRVGKDATFFDIRVPGETKRYVDRFLAHAAVFADPGRYGVELPLSDDEFNAIAFVVVDTGGQVDLVRAAEEIGCGLDEIRRRNPDLKRWATHPEGPHRLIVGARDRIKAEQVLAGMPEAVRLQWVRHRIASGETLSGIAQAYRTDVATLKQANRMRGTLIRAGDHLLVPDAHRDFGGHWDAGSSAGANGIYVVKAGDTIWGIARRLGLEYKMLMAVNQIGPNDILSIGRRLSIPL